MTTESNRRQKARNAAERYAPAPNGSMLTHAVVGLSIAVMLMFVIASFYGVDFSRLPILAAGLALAAGGAGIAVNRIRTGRNRRAIENEYRSQGAQAGPYPRPGPPSTPQGSE